MGLGIAALGREFTYRKISSGMIKAMRIAYSAFLFTLSKLKTTAKVQWFDLRLKKFIGIIT